MKTVKRVLSLALILVMVFSYYLFEPSKALANGIQRREAIEAYNQVNDYSGNAALAYSPLIGEDENAREESIKVFRRADGAREAVVYAQPIHFQRDGAWETIDNTLELVTLEDGSQVYRNRANDFAVSFAPLFSSDELVTVELNGQSLSWRFVGSDPSIVPATEPEEPAVPEVEVEQPVLPEAEPEEPAVPEVEVEQPALPEAEPEEPAVPEVGAEQPDLPEVALEEPALTEAEAEEPALPEVEPEEPALPEAETEQPALPEAGAEQPTAPQITPPISAEGAAQEDEDDEDTGLDESEEQDTANLPDLSLFDTLPVTDAAAIVSAQEATTTELLTDEARDMQLRFPTQLTSEISYTDAAAGLNVRYVLSGKTLSEYITLDSAPTRAVAYTVEISSNGLLPQTDADGRTAFVNSQGAEVFQLGSAVMFDAAGEQSGEIEAYLTATDADAGTYTYTLIPDLQWLQSADRQYPLSIDPDIKVNVSNSIQDTYVASANKNSNYHTGQSMNVGGTAAEGLVYIPNSVLPTLSSGDVILQSCLYLSRYNANSSYSNATSAVYKVTSSWSESTVTWNTKPSYDTSGSIAMGVSSVQYYANPFDITRAVQEWYTSPSSNKGLLFKGTSGSSLFCTSEYTGTASRKPYLTVIYRNSTGLEDTWTYYSQNIGRAGTGSINAFSGNLNMSHADAAINNGAMTISLAHVYNTNDRATNIGYGYGWRLNYAQSITKVTVASLDGTATYYRHIDADGTRHYYRADGTSTTRYVNEQDKDTVLTISGTTVTITDKEDNKLIFACDSSVANGRLTTIRDANGNETNIAYTTTTITNLRIASITEKLAGGTAGQALSLTYESDLLSEVSAPDGLNVSYSYTSTNLTGITYADGESISYTYNGNRCLTKATNIDNYSITYSYTTGAPYRVTRAAEAAGATSGQYLTFAYGRNRTTVTDAQGHRTVYHTDNLGQPVSVTDPQGRAVYATYNTGDRTVTELTAVSKMQSTVVNLLKNHGFEESTYPSSWTRSTTSYIKNDSSRRHTGAYSCKIDAGTAARTLTQTVNVTVGQVYTLSAYFSGTLNTAYLKVTNGSSTVQSPAVTAGGTGWNREVLTFTAAASSITVAVVVPVGSGTVYVDSIQLEKGSVPNRYNLIMNSDFTNGTKNYTMNYGSDCAVVDVSDAKYAAARTTHPTMLDDKVYEMNGKVQGIKIKQTYQSGDTGDTYTFGAWVASNNVPHTEQKVYYGTSGSNHMAEYGIKRLVLQFLNSSGTVMFSSHVDFAADTDEWQYVSGTFTTPRSYAQMQLVVEYTNSLNTLYVDGVQLYKEEFATGYSYDSAGNLSGTVSLIGQENTFDYDANDNLTSATDARGNTTTYTYDSKHNLLTSTSPQGVVTTNTYNAAGLPTETKVGNSTSYIRTTTTYDSASALATGVTDARGNTVLTQYDAATRLATQITDARETDTTYGYDGMNRVNAITSGDSGVTYAYTDDRLTAVTVDGAVYYGLTYDGVGRTVSTRAGTSATNLATLATNTYNNTSGLLTQTAYGNGLTVSYVYDSLNRPVEVKYNGASRYKYVYDGAGNLYSAQDVSLGFTIYYEYDHSGRCMKSVTKNGSGTVLASYAYQYDGNDNLTKLTCSTNGTTWETTYAYDKDNRPTTATLANGKAVTNTYDAIGRLSARKIGTYTTTLSYVAGVDGSQTALVSSYKNGTDAAFQYTYDANGNITHLQQGTNHVYYEYDSLNQLVREDNSILNKSITYTYDDRGNILNKAEYAYVANGGTLGTATDTITYGYEAEHQAWADQLTSYDGEAIRYDASGNPTTYRGYTMTWQGRRLTGATGNGNTLSYSYDENGLRTQKTVNGTATQYRYHGSVLISQVTGSNKLLFSYDANGNAVAVNYNGTYYYYVRNGQNDVIRLIDGSNNAVVEYSYDSWGRLLSCTGSLASTLGTQNPFRYRGYVYDTETGLYYVTSRYYDPEIGRWINADTTDVLSLPYYHLGQYNLFSYCNNNPVNDRDDDGLLSWLAKIAIGVAAIAIGVGVTALTGGAALPALVAGVKAACVAGAISAGTSAATTAARSAVSGDSFSTVVQKSAKAAVDGFADGFMAGGIAAGASQVASGGFKIAAKLGAKTGKSGGIKIGNTKILSPDAAWHKNNGGTLLKIGKTFRIDVGSNTLLHMHLPNVSSHIQIGTIGAGIYGGLK